MPSSDANGNADLLHVVGTKQDAKPQGFLASQFAKSAPADYGEYAGTGTEAVTGDTLLNLRTLAQEQMDLEREVEKRTKALADAVADLVTIQEHKLPDLMETHGLPLFNFVDGVTGIEMVIKLDAKWRVSMPPKKDPSYTAKAKRIFEWIREIGQKGIIKRDMITTLGLVDDAEAEILITEFKAAHPDLDVVFEQKIEPATLTALISRRKDAGDAVIDDIQVKPYKAAKVSVK